MILSVRVSGELNRLKNFISVLSGIFRVTSFDIIDDFGYEGVAFLKIDV